MRDACCMSITTLNMVMREGTLQITCGFRVAKIQFRSECSRTCMLYRGIMIYNPTTQESHAGNSIVRINPYYWKDSFQIDMTKVTLGIMTSLARNMSGSETRIWLFPMHILN